MRVGESLLPIQIAQPVRNGSVTYETFVGKSQKQRVVGVGDPVEGARDAARRQDLRRRVEASDESNKRFKAYRLFGEYLVFVMVVGVFSGDNFWDTAVLGWVRQDIQARILTLLSGMCRLYLYTLPQRRCNVHDGDTHDVGQHD